MSKKIDASVLAFEKKLVPSDGLMFGTTWNGRNEQAQALTLQEKSVRGTISNRLKKAIANDPLKLDAEIEKANLQKVDSCSLSPQQDTLKLEFTLKVLSGVEAPSASNGENFNKTYPKVVKQYIADYGFTELAKRYVINLANGRFLWRNRVGCENLEVRIQIISGSDDWSATFNCNNYQNFASNDENIDYLTNKIATTLSGKQEYLLLKITAFAQVGQSQDVYPSEELVLDKSNNTKGKKSKILFAVDKVAAMHSQKIGNAIRTIDTWYSEYQKTQKPIAVDPYGAVTTLGKAFRNPKAKTDFFTLFDKFAQDEEINEDDKHFVMAVLVRGGVFGESSK
jgi:CRISPR-associated protein Csy3